MIFSIICFIIAIALLVERLFLASFVFVLLGIKLFKYSKGSGKAKYNLDQYKYSDEDERANPVKHTYSRGNAKKDITEKKIRTLMALECLSYSQAKRRIISEYNQKNI